MRRFKSAYTAGLNAGKVRPNTSNCNFSWFATQESMREWEAGNSHGKALKEQSIKRSNTGAEGERREPRHKVDS